MLSKSPLAFFAVILALPASSFAQTTTPPAGATAPTAEEQECLNLLGVSQVGMLRDVDRQMLVKKEVCDAYKFLISRYTPGPRSSVGLSNPKVQGIVKLNPDFAVRLAQMLKAMPMQVMIASAYRTPEGQGSKNPNSNHPKGCAVDLAYLQSSCSQEACQWVLKNSAQFKLHIRMKYSPEWNHIEPIDIRACQEGRAGNPNIPSPTPSTPTQAIQQSLQRLLNPPQQPMPLTPLQTLPSSQTPQLSPVSAPLATNPTTAPVGATIATPQQTPVSSGTNTNTAGTQLPTIPLTTPLSTASGSSSAFNLISAFAGYEATSSTIGIAVPVSVLLNTGGEDVQLTDDGGDIVAVNATSGLSSSLPSAFNSETFTTADLNPDISGYQPQQLSTFQQTLNRVKESLTAIVNALKPFGGLPHEDHDE